MNNIHENRSEFKGIYSLFIGKEHPSVIGFIAELKVFFIMMLD